MDSSTLGFPVLHHLPELAHTQFHWISEAIQPSHPLSSPSLHQGSFPASGSFPINWLFTLGGQSIGVSASASVLPINIQDWFPLGLINQSILVRRSRRSLDLLAVQGTLKSLLQHHQSSSPKASILGHSAFFMVQLSHLYLTTGKTVALSIQTFVDKVMPLLFNMLSRFVRFSSKEEV